ncbi:hypothetical protein LJC22_06760 [Desulfosarcina sp. OttesenSCG-928-G10]|nr:hypothetical protein [Desulfosarcina sp. OttesenSCG-928-G10]
MKMNDLGTGENSTRSFEIRSGTIGYRGLVHMICNIPGAVLTYAAHDTINGDTKLIVVYKNATITIETLWADYIMYSHDNAFDEFVEALKKYQLKWWERIF